MNREKMLYALHVLIATRETVEYHLDMERTLEVNPDAEKIATLEGKNRDLTETIYELRKELNIPGF